MKLEQLERVPLGHYPTPLEPLPALTAALGGGRLYLKRDDLTGPGLGGNKTRKLEFLLAQALAEGCTAVLTEGGPQTNHGRTTAAACAKLGLKPILVLSGEAPEALTGNLTLDAMTGADLIFAGDDRKGAIPALMARYEARGERVFYIPTGGSTPLGAAGYILAVRELMDQCREMAISPRHLVCAVGSLGTYGGLVLGVRHFGAPFHVIGVPVEPAPADLPAQAAKFINDAARALELDISVAPRDLRLELGPPEAPYAGPGYNVPDPLTREAVYTLARTEGVFLDPTYTGKAFRGMTHLIRTGALEGDVIFLHTGGSPALWAEDHLAAMQEELRARCSVENWRDGHGA